MTEALNRDYRVCEEIGRGRFGIVFRCVSVSTGESFAVKSIDKTSITEGLDAQCLVVEPKILSLLSPHPHILRLYDLYEDEMSLNIVSEFCQNGDLFKQIAENNGTIPEAAAKSVFTQLMRAIAHCHTCGVVHRDIKPDNILLDSRGDVKLADFGSSDVAAVDGGGGIVGVVGTPYYVAPEVLSGSVYGEKVDVWSAGVVLYVMLAGFPPFYGESPVEIFEAVLRANLRFPGRVFHVFSPEVKDLLRIMLCKDVNRRYSADQVLRHPWVTSGGITNLT